jgi:hypothetical protein
LRSCLKACLKPWFRGFGPCPQRSCPQCFRLSHRKILHTEIYCHAHGQVSFAQDKCSVQCTTTCPLHNHAPTWEARPPPPPPWPQLQPPGMPSATPQTFQKNGTRKALESSMHSTHTHTCTGCAHSTHTHACTECKQEHIVCKQENSFVENCVQARKHFCARARHTHTKAHSTALLTRTRLQALVAHTRLQGAHGARMGRPITCACFAAASSAAFLAASSSAAFFAAAACSSSALCLAAASSAAAAAAAAAAASCRAKQPTATPDSANTRFRYNPTPDSFCRAARQATQPNTRLGWAQDPIHLGQATQPNTRFTKRPGTVQCLLFPSVAPCFLSSFWTPPGLAIDGTAVSEVRPRSTNPRQHRQKHAETAQGSAAQASITPKA